MEKHIEICFKKNKEDEILSLYKKLKSTDEKFEYLSSACQYSSVDLFRKCYLLDEWDNNSVSILLKHSISFKNYNVAHFILDNNSSCIHTIGILNSILTNVGFIEDKQFFKRLLVCTHYDNEEVTSILKNILINGNLEQFKLANDYLSVTKGMLSLCLLEAARDSAWDYINYLFQQDVFLTSESLEKHKSFFTDDVYDYLLKVHQAVWEQAKIKENILTDKKGQKTIL